MRLNLPTASAFISRITGRLFAAKPTQLTKPATAALYTDQATNRFLELLLQFPDPDYVLREAGLSRADLRRLESDDEVSAALETRLSACLATDWRLDPEEGNVGAFLQEQLEEHVETLITGAWAAVPYGYSVQELIYKRDGQRITWDRIEERPFEWFKPSPNGDLRYFSSTAQTGLTLGEAVDTNFKFLLTRRRATFRNPYGESVLSRLYWPWFFRQNGWRFWARFLERFGAPLLIGKTDGDTTEMAQSLALAVSSAVAAIGAEDSVEIATPGNAGDSFQRFSAAVDKRIQKVILGQTLTTDVDGKGSYAAASVHDEIRDDRRIADVRLVARTVQHAINALTALNFPGAEPPLFILEDEVGLQPDRAERDSKLYSSGVIGQRIRFTKDYLLRAYDFEEDDLEEVAEQQPPGETEEEEEEPTAAPVSASASRTIRALTLRATNEALPLEGIRLAALAATDLEDLRAILGSIIDETDDRFSAAVAKAKKEAYALGYLGEEQEPERQQSQPPIVLNLSIEAARPGKRRITRAPDGSLTAETIPEDGDATIQ